MKIEHIAMYVQDLSAARNFFVKYFDAIPGADYHNTKTDFRSCFLSFAGGPRLELMTKPELSDSGDCLNRFGYAHIAFSVGSKLSGRVRLPYSHWIRGRVHLSERGADDHGDIS